VEWPVGPSTASEAARRRVLSACACPHAPLPFGRGHRVLLSERQPARSTGAPTPWSPSPAIVSSLRDRGNCVVPLPPHRAPAASDWHRRPATVVAVAITAALVLATPPRAVPPLRGGDATTRCGIVAAAKGVERGAVAILHAVLLVTLSV